MRALWWKEWRAVRWVLLSGCLGVLGLYLMNVRDEVDFDPRILVFFVTAFLGAEAFANERGQGTLPFLLTRPLSVWRLLVPKVLVRLAAALVLLAVYWVAVYCLPDSSQGLYTTVFSEFLRSESGPGRMILVWALPGVFLFSIALLASALADSTLIALIAALPFWILACAVTATAVYFYHPSWDAAHVLPFDLSNGYLWRAVMDSGALLYRVGLWLGLSLLACSVCGFMLRRRVQWSLSGKFAAVPVFMLVPAFIAGYVLEKRPMAPSVGPVAELPLASDWVGNLAVYGDKAYFVKGMQQSVLQVVDVSVPRQPQTVQEFNLPENGMLAVDGERVYITAVHAKNENRTGPNSARMTVVDLDGNGLAVAWRQVQVNQEGGNGVVSEPVPFGNHVYWGLTDMNGSRLIAWSVDGDKVKEAAVLHFKSISEGDREKWGEARLWQGIHQKYSIGFVRHGGRLFVRDRDDLHVVDISDPGQMTRVGRLSLKRHPERRNKKLCRPCCRRHSPAAVAAMLAYQNRCLITSE